MGEDRQGGHGRPTASDGIGGTGAVTVPPVQKCHPGRASCFNSTVYTFFFFPSWIPSPQGVSASDRGTQPTRTQARFPKAKPPLQFRFSWQRPTLELTSSPVMSEEIPHLTKDCAPIANKLNSLTCPVLGPRIWRILRTHSKRDSCCCKVNVFILDLRMSVDLILT